MEQEHSGTFVGAALARLRRNRTRHSASVRSPCSKLPPKTVSIQPCVSRQSGVAASAGECQKAVQEKYSDHRRRGQRHLQCVSGSRRGVSHHLPRRDKTLNCSKTQSSGFGDGRSRVERRGRPLPEHRRPSCCRAPAPICRAKALRVRTARSSPRPLAEFCNARALTDVDGKPVASNQSRASYEDATATFQAVGNST